ncbi:hypothetical protein SCALM49S_04258 [Streptomyces californicus]
MPVLRDCVTAYTLSQPASPAIATSRASSSEPMPRRCHSSSARRATSVSSPSHRRWPSATTRPEAVRTARVRPKRGLSRWSR